jgi:hypothetical protein
MKSLWNSNKLYRPIIGNETAAWRESAVFREKRTRREGVKTLVTCFF